MKSFNQFITESDEEIEVKLYRIGKTQSYFNLNDQKDNDGYYTIRKGNPKDSDGFVAGEDQFIINKNEVEIANQKVYKATNDELDDFIIYIDGDGVLYTDDNEKKVLYKRILQ